LFPHTLIEIRAFITMPFHGIGIQAGVLTPVKKNMKDFFNPGNHKILKITVQTNYLSTTGGVL